MTLLVPTVKFTNYIKLHKTTNTTNKTNTTNYVKPLVFVHFSIFSITLWICGGFFN